MPKPTTLKQRSWLLFLIGLTLHTAINVILAARMEVHFDEAYYWLYSQYPDWGYFDHPPMVAWFIIIGQALFKGNLGLRFMTLLNTTLGLVLLWDMAKKYKPDAILFWAVVYSVILIHPYAFIATPDAPVWVFTILFFYVYKKYLTHPALGNSLLVALAIALMLYSKYHGVLVIGFTVLSNLKLMKKWSFWFIVACTLVYFSPHLLWQINNHFPTVQYQLIDGHKGGFSIKVVLNYIFSELLLVSPFLFWLYFYAMWKNKGDQWERALQFTGIGTFLFFFITSFKGGFEAHWTLIAFVPIILLVFKFVVENPKWEKWVKVVAIVNFTALLVVKVLIMTPVGAKINAFKTFAGWEKSSKELRQAVGNYPVVFLDTWNRAARFAYYTDDKTVCNLNSALYRHNQFDLWDLDEELTGDTVYVLTIFRDKITGCDSIVTSNSTWYGKKIANFHSYFNMSFTLDKLEKGQGTYHAEVTVSNPYEEAVLLGSEGNIPALFQLSHPIKKGWSDLSETPINKLYVPARGSAKMSFDIAAPSPMPKEKLYLVLKIGELFPIPSRYDVMVDR